MKTELSRSFGLLDEVARALNDRQTINVRIVGHTDSVGNEKYNKELNVGRALYVST